MNERGLKERKTATRIMGCTLEGGFLAKLDVLHSDFSLTADLRVDCTSFMEVDFKLDQLELCHLCVRRFAADAHL